jgi:phage tail-like protein
VADKRRPHDHIGNFAFKVEIEGVTSGAFKECSGLDSETDVIEYQDGPDMVLHKRPGQTKYSNITLKRGYVNNPELWNWRKQIMEGVYVAKSGSVILCDNTGDEVMRYNFFDAWPCKWKGFSLDGKGNDVVVEEIELAVERLIKA